MRRQGLLTDKTRLIEALERETGMKAYYRGAPSFQYIVGDCTVFRDGSLECDDEELMEKLSEAGLIEREVGGHAITFPTEAFTGRAMVNLINSFSAREKLINKAIGEPNAFHMAVGLVRKLKAENPSTVGEFMEVLYACGGEKAMRGIHITTGSVQITGFPDTPACTVLADLMVKAATRQGWIKADAKEYVNEKYSFRVWLNAIGMRGEEYKSARRELLKNLEGDGAYRTEEQRQAFLQRRRKPMPEQDFVLL